MGPADTAILAWFGPTPYALARLVRELKAQVEELAAGLDASHLQTQAVRYPSHPPRKLVEYVGVRQRHTARHLEAIRKKMAAMPPSQEWDEDVRSAWPDFGRGGGFAFPG